DALLDSLFETDVCVTRAFSSEIANRREACLQSVAQVVRCSCDAQTQRFARHLVVPNSFAVRMQEHVRMRFDQTGHQRQTRKIDHFRARRPADGTCWSSRLDLLTAHEHHPVVMKLGRLTVEAMSRPQ